MAEKIDALKQAIKNVPQEILKNTLSFLAFNDFFGVLEGNRYVLGTVSKQFRQAIEKEPEIQETFREFISGQHKIESIRFFFNSERVKDRIIQGHSTVLQLLGKFPIKFFSESELFLDKNYYRKPAIELGVFPEEMYYHGFSRDHVEFLKEIVKVEKSKWIKETSENETSQQESKDSNEKEEISISEKLQSERKMNASVRKELEAGIKNIENLDELQMFCLKIGLSREQVYNEKFKPEYRANWTHKDHLEKFWEQLNKSNDSRKVKLEKFRLEFEAVKGLSYSQLSGLKLYSLKDVFQPWFSFIHEDSSLNSIYPPAMLRGYTRRHLMLLYYIPYQEMASFVEKARQGFSLAKEITCDHENLGKFGLDQKKHLIYYNLTVNQYNLYPHLAKDLELLEILRRRHYDFEELVTLEKIHVHTLKSGISLEIVKKCYKDLYPLTMDDISLIISEIKQEIAAVKLDDPKPVGLEKLEQKIAGEKKDSHEQQTQAKLDQLFEQQIMDMRGLKPHQIEGLRLGLTRAQALKCCPEHLIMLKELKLKKQEKQFDKQAIQQAFKEISQLSPTHFYLSKDTFNGLKQLSRYQLEAIKEFGLAIEQVANGWFMPDHLKALQNGRHYDEINGLTILQARALAIAPSLSRAQVTELWFRKEHLEAIEEGFSYDEIQNAKSIDAVIKLRKAGTIPSLNEIQATNDGLNEHSKPALLLSFNMQTTNDHLLSANSNGDQNPKDGKFAKHA